MGEEMLDGLTIREWRTVCRQEVKAREDADEKVKRMQAEILDLLWECEFQGVFDFGARPVAEALAAPRFKVEPYGKSAFGVRDGKTGGWCCRKKPKSYCVKEAKRLNQEIKAGA
jgi:hypothetical protein